MYKKRTEKNDSFKKKPLCYLAFGVFFLSLSLLAQVEIAQINQDKPLKGKWDFRMVKIGEISEAGDDVFASLGKILTDEKENLYVMDPKNFKVHIFDKDGKFVTSFGKRGEGPGEMRRMNRFFLAGGQLIFPERNKVHYFSTQGKYLKSVVIPGSLRPRTMIDEKRLISVPWTNWRNPGREAAAFIYNLEDKSKKVLFEFSTFIKRVVRKSPGQRKTSFSYSHSSLTPMMVLGYHDNKVYYGMNNVYKIIVKDIRTMENRLVFSLEREKTKVPERFKDEVLKEINQWPDNVKKEIKYGFPDYFTYFYGIFADHNRNIYVYVTDTGEPNRRKLDIFSPAGKYIYQAEIVAAEDEEIQGVHWKTDKLYMGIETEEGELKLVKYWIRLPQ